MKFSTKLLTVGCLGLLFANESQALDSYRYLHVTIETPWGIFLFLLIGVLSPFVLMAVLVWRHSDRTQDKRNETKPEDQNHP